VTCPLPAVALTAVGAPGVADGVTLFEAAEGAPVPMKLVAATVNVYAVPLVRPVTVAVVVVPLAVVAMSPPGEDVTV
jgi:hypothetical protein